MNVLSKPKQKRRKNKRRDAFKNECRKGPLRGNSRLFPGFPAIDEQGLLEWQCEGADPFANSSSLGKRAALSGRQLKKLVNLLKVSEESGRPIHLGAYKFGSDDAAVLREAFEQHIRQKAKRRIRETLNRKLPKRLAQRVDRLANQFSQLEPWLDKIRWLSVTGGESNAASTISWFETSALAFNQILSAPWAEEGQLVRLIDALFEIRGDCTADMMDRFAMFFRQPSFHHEMSVSSDYLDLLQKKCENAWNYQDFSIPARPNATQLVEIMIAAIEGIGAGPRAYRRNRLKLLATIAHPDAIKQMAHGAEGLAAAENDRLRYLRQAEHLFRIRLGKSLYRHKLSQSKNRDFLSEGYESLPEEIERRIRGVQAFVWVLVQVLNTEWGRCYSNSDLLEIGTSQLRAWFEKLPGEEAYLAAILIQRWVLYTSDRNRRIQKASVAIREIIRCTADQKTLCDEFVQYLLVPNQVRNDVVAQVAREDWLSDEHVRRFVRFTFRLVVKFAELRESSWLSSYPGLLVDGINERELTDMVELLCSRSGGKCEFSASAIKLGYRFGSDPLSRAMFTELIDREVILSDIARRKFVSSTRNFGEFFDRYMLGLALDNQKPEIERLERFVKVLNWIPGKKIELRPLTNQLPKWAKRFPESLHGSLRDLAQVDQDAMKTASKILGQNFPDPHRVENELSGLKRKITELVSRPNNCNAQEDQLPVLQLRVAKLEKRLNDPPEPVSETRIENLVKKLRRRAQVKFVDRFAECTKETLCSLVSDSNASQAQPLTERPPARVWESPYLEIFSSLSDVGQTHRKVGYRLLVDHLQGRESKLDCHPANVNFVERLRRKGVDMGPWLNSTTRLCGKTAKGESYEVYLTSDTMDYFLMGKHFQTCLTPGNFNFFNTVAIAADVNKRVVYGKTASGRVIGRCLLALKSNGDLLTYWHYSHSDKDKFASLVCQFAQQLADQMGVNWAHEGDVEPLVVSDWYDDGPICSDESAESKQAKRVDSFFEKLEDAVRKNPHQPRLFQLREFLGSDESGLKYFDRILTVVGLLEGLQRDEWIRYLASAGKLTVVQRLNLVGLVDPDFRNFAQQLLSEIPQNRLLRCLVRRYDLNNHYFDGLPGFGQLFRWIVEFVPSIALRFMRATCQGHPEVRQPKVRRRALMEIYRRLNRTRQSERLMKTLK